MCWPTPWGRPVADTIALPDIELLVTDHLRARIPDVTVATGLVGWRRGQAWLQVIRTGGQVRYNWLDAAEIAVEARGASREAAAALAGLARDALAGMPWTTHTGAVVSAATELRGPRWLPDPDGDGRYRLEWRITAHPHKSEGGP